MENHNDVMGEGSIPIDLNENDARDGYSANSADSAGGEGNNRTSPPKKQCNPLRYACFTMNNYTEDNIIELKTKFAALATKWIIGREIGASGTPHLQGAVQFNQRLRPISAIGMKIHWEKMKGTWTEATTYCAKEGDYTSVGVS